MVSLKSFMKMGGEKFEVIRDNRLVSEVMGLPNREEGSKRPYIGFVPEADIKSGDWVKGIVSSDLLFIEDTKSQIFEGAVFQIKGYYLTKKEFEDVKLKVQQSNPPTIIYNLNGANTRVNNNSTDNSFNVVDMSTKLFDQIRNVVNNEIKNEDEKRELREIITEMEISQGSNKFNQVYTNFITSAANHMSIISPFIPELSKMIQSWIYHTNRRSFDFYTHSYGPEF